MCKTLVNKRCFLRSVGRNGGGRVSPPSDNGAQSVEIREEGEEVREEGSGPGRKGLTEED
jgi:hypothetical protein